MRARLIRRSIVSRSGRATTSSESETEHMGFPGHTRVGSDEGELGDEPKQEEEHRGHCHDDEEEPAQDPMRGEEHEVCPHDAGDRTGSSDEGIGDIPIQQHESERGHDACSEVEQQEADAAEGFLDVVAEDPQEPHVAEQMAETGVEEHRHHNGEVHVLVGEDGSGRRFGAVARGDLLSAQRVPGRELTGDGGVLVHEALFLGDIVERLNEQEDGDVGCDERQRHDRRDGGGVDVPEWDHWFYPLVRR